MPNWCHNTLTVTGDEESLAAFVEKAKLPEQAARELYESTWFIGVEEKPPLEEWLPKARESQPLSFHSFVPIAPGDDWYHWCIRNWGTKWDASFSQPMVAIGDEGMDAEESAAAKGSTVTPTVAVYKFDTAWSPPIPVVEAMSEQHHELAFVLRFAEVGHGLAGEVKYVAGLLMEQEELEVEDVLLPQERWF